jgi:hypothetical protein
MGRLRIICNSLLHRELALESFKIVKRILDGLGYWYNNLALV